ncbi:hypothetical protein [Paenibacillus sp. FSL A5-0031]|uniref:hypothetical protein n=1 Tax=Paenibacillus sp. FSL A5-0031 TaxID=1920420 RepID=UPI0011855670|nr:hypothetical protein [Paenibacillus sp. FSL A5-0031]
MSPIKLTLTMIVVATLVIGCMSQPVRPDDKVIDAFISDNNINVMELVKYKEYTAIAYKNDTEVGFYLDQSGSGTFSKHWENVEGTKIPQRFIGGFSDKYLVEYIIDENILNQIITFTTRTGTFTKKTFTKEPNQKCFIFPTGTGGIQYFDKNNKSIEFRS